MILLDGFLKKLTKKLTAIHENGRFFTLFTTTRPVHPVKKYVQILQPFKSNIYLQLAARGPHVDLATLQAA
jgi:hypothetical protein